MYYTYTTCVTSIGTPRNSYVQNVTVACLRKFFIPPKSSHLCLYSTYNLYIYILQIIKTACVSQSDAQ